MAESLILLKRWIMVLEVLVLFSRHKDFWLVDVGLAILLLVVDLHTCCHPEPETTNATGKRPKTS